LGVDIDPEPSGQRSAKEERIIAGFEENRAILGVPVAIGPKTTLSLKAPLSLVYAV
jgi:hypothetical protein